MLRDYKEAKRTLIRLHFLMKSSLDSSKPRLGEDQLSDYRKAKEAVERLAQILKSEFGFDPNSNVEQVTLLEKGIDAIITLEKL